MHREHVFEIGEDRLVLSQSKPQGALVWGPTAIPNFPNAFRTAPLYNGLSGNSLAA